MVPKNLLKEWAMSTFKSATDYWTFRKMFTLQLALAGFAEYVLHLSRLNPDMMYVHQDSGLVNISYFKVCYYLNRHLLMVIWLFHCLPDSTGQF